MAISTFDMFSIGIGPSSSHTVGPMRASVRFLERLAERGLQEAVVRVKVELFGSLGATGKGHGSDRAVLMGLEGELPESVEPDDVEPRVATIAQARQLRLAGTRAIEFDVARDLVFHRRQVLPKHPNGMRFTALAGDDTVLLEREYYSVGGGFVVSGAVDDDAPIVADPTPVAFPFRTGDELLQQCRTHGLSISTLMFRNEQAWRTPDEIRARLALLWATMSGCIARGCEREGILPGGLKVRRRAAALHRKLQQRGQAPAGTRAGDGLALMDWVNLWALAVNEENAAGGRVVTAPTNGAAGIIPAVLQFYRHDCPHAGPEAVERFLLTAAAIGILYKINASISGAEVGCQGEVGVACSMAAAGLAEVMGGTPAQVENAAEIGMEHNLGLTCDPVGGLVQVPCIERNAMGAVKAINAARLALQGDGDHKVSLDRVIATMRQTGADMKTKYKETARGGLAVNIVEC
jgi:L-serine dehydratase